ncbi:lipid asymmetry maintenance protein MlaB [Ideonella sp. A 288]|uniref:STAS domain-containing protein n=1 Tax=Ideonella sp. A 288 TaxID=1962181 RepID=UPI000B4AA1F7|nr:STAS domain-containing protein [Ideonella sp. A 288]
MASTRKSPRAGTTLRVEGELTIFRVAELKPMLLGNAALTELDLSGVCEIDTAGLQLLMVARRQAEAQQRRLRLVNRSTAVEAMFERVNVAAFFGDALDPEPAATRTAGRRATPATTTTTDGAH